MARKALLFLMCLFSVGCQEINYDLLSKENSDVIAGLVGPLHYLDDGTPKKAMVAYDQNTGIYSVTDDERPQYFRVKRVTDPVFLVQHPAMSYNWLLFFKLEQGVVSFAQPSKNSELQKRLDAFAKEVPPTSTDAALMNQRIEVLKHLWATHGHEVAWRVFAVASEDKLSLLEDKQEPVEQK